MKTNSKTLRWRKSCPDSPRPSSAWTISTRACRARIRRIVTFFRRRIAHRFPPCPKSRSAFAVSPRSSNTTKLLRSQRSVQAQIHTWTHSKRAIHSPLTKVATAGRTKNCHSSSIEPQTMKRVQLGLLVAVVSSRICFPSSTSRAPSSLRPSHSSISNNRSIQITSTTVVISQLSIHRVTSSISKNCSTIRTCVCRIRFSRVGGRPREMGRQAATHR